MLLKISKIHRQALKSSRIEEINGDLIFDHFNMFFSRTLFVSSIRASLLSSYSFCSELTAKLPSIMLLQANALLCDDLVRLKYRKF